MSSGYKKTEKENKLKAKQPTKTSKKKVTKFKSAPWVFLDIRKDDSGDSYFNWPNGGGRIYSGFIYGNPYIGGDARVYGDAQVYGNAQVYGDAWVYGNAQVYGKAGVYGDARVYGNAEVYGDAW